MNRNKKLVMRTAAIALCTVMTIDHGTYVYGAGKNSIKDENVYVNLEQNGSVDDIYIVNEFDRKQPGHIVDYGEYSSVKNLTTDDKLTLEGNKVSGHIPEGKFYYQGNVKSKEIPWDIKISYYLDGVKKSADEVAGKSGKVKIRIQVKENKACEKDFFDYYLLQATVVLDTEKCSDIKADGATAANVGKNRQLVYNIMAGQEKDIVITAKVKNFEMEAISFQGVPMSFDLDEDILDTSSLTDETKKITDAVD